MYTHLTLRPRTIRPAGRAHNRAAATRSIRRQVRPTLQGTCEDQLNVSYMSESYAATLSSRRQLLPALQGTWVMRGKVNSSKGKASLAAAEVRQGILFIGIK